MKEWLVRFYDTREALALRRPVLADAMARCGIRSIRQLAKAAGGHYPTTCGIVSGRTSPLAENGRSRTDVRRICEVLGETPERLFGARAPRMSPAGAAPSPAQEMEAREVSRVIRRALGTLTCRERQVLVLRYYENASEQNCAEALRVSPERVELLEAKALRKLRRLRRTIDRMIR